MPGKSGKKNKGKEPVSKKEESWLRFSFDSIHINGSPQLRKLCFEQSTDPKKAPKLPDWTDTHRDIGRDIDNGSVFFVNGKKIEPWKTQITNENEFIKHFFGQDEDDFTPTPQQRDWARCANQTGFTFQPVNAFETFISSTYTTNVPGLETKDKVTTHYIEVMKNGDINHKICVECPDVVTFEEQTELFKTGKGENADNKMKQAALLRQQEDRNRPVVIELEKRIRTRETTSLEKLNVTTECFNFKTNNIQLFKAAPPTTLQERRRVAQGSDQFHEVPVYRPITTYDLIVSSRKLILSALENVFLNAEYGKEKGKHHLALFSQALLSNNKQNELHYHPNSTENNPSVKGKGKAKSSTSQKRPNELLKEEYDRLTEKLQENRAGSTTELTSSEKAFFNIYETIMEIERCFIARNQRTIASIKESITKVIDKRQEISQSNELVVAMEHFYDEIDTAIYSTQYPSEAAKAPAVPSKYTDIVDTTSLEALVADIEKRLDKFDGAIISLDNETINEIFIGLTVGDVFKSHYPLNGHRCQTTIDAVDNFLPTINDKNSTPQMQYLKLLQGIREQLVSAIVSRKSLISKFSTEQEEDINAFLQIATAGSTTLVTLFETFKQQAATLGEPYTKVLNTIIDDAIATIKKDDAACKKVLAPTVRVHNQRSSNPEHRLIQTLSKDLLTYRKNIFKADGPLPSALLQGNTLRDLYCANFEGSYVRLASDDKKSEIDKKLLGSATTTEKQDLIQARKTWYQSRQIEDDFRLGAVTDAEFLQHLVLSTSQQPIYSEIFDHLRTLDPQSAELKPLIKIRSLLKVCTHELNAINQLTSEYLALDNSTASNNEGKEKLLQIESRLEWLKYSVRELTNDDKNIKTVKSNIRTNVEKMLKAIHEYQHEQLYLLPNRQHIKNYLDATTSNKKITQILSDIVPSSPRSEATAETETQEPATTKKVTEYAHVIAFAKTIQKFQNLEIDPKELCKQIQIQIDTYSAKHGIWSSLNPFNWFKKEKRHGWRHAKNMKKLAKIIDQTYVAHMSETITAAQKINSNTTPILTLYANKMAKAIRESNTYKLCVGVLGSSLKEHDKKSEVSEYASSINNQDRSKGLEIINNGLFISEKVKDAANSRKTLDKVFKSYLRTPTRS